MKRMASSRMPIKPAASISWLRDAIGRMGFLGCMGSVGLSGECLDFVRFGKCMGRFDPNRGNVWVLLGVCGEGAYLPLR